MRLELLDSELAICRLDPAAAIPAWARGELVATVRTGEELSVVCDADAVPADTRADRGWRALRVAGTLDLTLTGVLATILAPLAAAEIPIFAVSSFDTDYVLVPAARLTEAAAVLRAAGHEF